MTTDNRCVCTAAMRTLCLLRDDLASIAAAHALAQILEYEKRRTNNEDIIKQIKALRAKSKDGAQEKTYVLMGDLFIRHTNAAAETLLVKDTSNVVVL